MNTSNTLQKTVSIVTLLTYMILLIVPSSFALPTGADVQSGDVTVTTSADTLNMNVTSGSQKSIINWNDYTIAANEAVYYAQPNSSSLSLNRDLGSDASQIFGKTCIEWSRMVY